MTQVMERASAALDDEAVAEASDTDGTVALFSLPAQTGLAKTKRRKLVTTFDLSNTTCKWPIGDPARADFHYCGEMPRTGRVYCGTHESMSYQPVTRKR